MDLDDRPGIKRASFGPDGGTQSANTRSPLGTESLVRRSVEFSCSWDLGCWLSIMYCASAKTGQ